MVPGDVAKNTCRRSTSEQMLACLFDTNGHVATVALQKCKTVNSEWYTTFFQPEVLNEIRKRRRREESFFSRQCKLTRFRINGIFVRPKHRQVIRYIVLIWHLMNSCFVTSKINSLVNNFRRQMKRLQRSKLMFQSYLNLY